MRSEVSLRRPIGGIRFEQPLEKKKFLLTLNWPSLSLVAEYFTQLPFFQLPPLLPTLGTDESRSDLARQAESHPKLFKCKEFTLQFHYTFL